MIGSTATQDDVTAYSIGQVTGSAVALLVVLGLAIKCFSIARRPTTNSKCACALGIVLSGWFLAALAGALGRWFPVSAPGMVIFGGLAVLGSAIGGTILAIIGLAEYRTAKQTYKQGRTQAVLALIISGLILAVAIAGGYGGVQRARNRAMAAGTMQPTAEQMLTFEEFNYQFRAPGRPWVQIDAKKFNPASSLVLVRSFPEVYFMVIAERVGADAEFDNQTLLEIAKANVTSRAASTRLLKEGPVQRQGLLGSQWETEAQMAGHELLYQQWVCITNGYAYQLTCWGRLRDAQRVREETERLFSRFTLIDHNRRSTVPSGVPATNFESTHYNYRVRVEGSLWRSWPTLAKELPEAEFGALRGQSGALAVVPVCLMGMKPAPEAVEQALLATMQVSYPNEKLNQVSRQHASGGEFRFERTVNEQNFLYRFQLLHAGDFAYMVAAWITDKSPNGAEVMEDALSRVEFLSPSRPPPDPKQFTPREKERHALVFNEVGLFYFKARQFEKSAPYFKAAFEMQRTNATYLLNVVNAWSNAGQDREALVYLDEHLPAFPQQQTLRAFQAYLQSRSQQPEMAVTNYAALFAGGFESEYHFTEYVKLLSDSRKPDEVLAEVQRYLKRSDSTAVRIVEANLYKQKKDFTNAIAILKAQQERAPYNAEGAFALADTYHQAGLYREAIDTMARLIERESDSAYAHYLKGRSEFGLKWYRQAKDSFELALKNAPASKEIKEFLDLVSGMLGEGQNTSIKTPVAAVGLPDALPKPPPVPGVKYAKDYGAYYVRRVYAISFEKKKALRSTDYLTIKILDATGVSRFSSIQVPFDPLAEEIFVNDLTVKDADGKTIAQGKVADYYVVDGGSKDLATHRKILNIPVPGLQPGYQIDLSVTRQDLTASQEFPFMEFSFSSSLPVLQSVVFIRGDVASLHYEASIECEPKAIEAGAYWLQENPVVYRWEPLQGTVDFLPTLWVGSSAATWQLAVTNYLQSIRDRLEFDAEQRALALKLTLNLKQESEKIAAIARYVQTNYTYKAIEFGRRARVPQKFGDIVHNRYGDCKDHSLLLKQLFGAAGIRADLALVNSRAAVQKDLPSVDQFDHMIVYLRSYQNGFFIDCTAKSGDPMQPVPTGLAGKPALIMDEGSARFVTIPEHTPESGVISSDRELQITNRTDVLIRETLTLSGYYGATLRSILTTVPVSDRRNFLREQMNSRTADIVDLTISNIDDSLSPLKMQMVYVLKRQFQSLENQILGHLPALWERRYMAVEPVENRQTPFQIMFPLVFQGTIQFKVPSGYRPPPPQSFTKEHKNAFANFKSTAQQQSQVLKIEFSLKQQTGNYPPAQYATYREGMEQTLNFLEQSLILLKR